MNLTGMHAVQAVGFIFIWAQSTISTWASRRLADSATQVATVLVLPFLRGLKDYYYLFGISDSQVNS